MSPGTGNGQPSSSTGSTAITCSAPQPPFSRWKRHIVLESAAPTKPCSASGSWSQRTSSGMSPFSPRSMVCSSVRRSRSQKWRRLAVAAGRDVVEVEALLVGVRLAELAGDEHVLARLVPEVVVERRLARRRSPSGPSPRTSSRRARRSRRRRSRRRRRASRRRCCRRACSGRCAGACSPVLRDDLLRLDHLLDLRAPRVGPRR